MRESELTGKRVELIRMEDPYTNLKPGDKGTIRGEDDMNHILVSWDNGSSLNLIRDIDEYKIEESSKIRRFYEFISSDSYLDAKLTELEEMVKSFTDGKDLMYHWENKNDESVVITFQVDRVALKYDFDIDEGYLTKTTDDQIEFEEMVESTEEGLEIIEKDIQLMFGISEGLDLDSLYDIKRNLERRIDDYFGGDKVYHGDQGYQDLLSDLEDIESQIEEAESGNISERVKAQRYKGRKIPGKYLTKNPSKMKKEIDRFIGKKEYKKDWDADYKSGKGGVGKRVKTKKSAATKAYQRMFGDK